MTSGGPPDAPWTPLGSPGDGVVSLALGGLNIGERDIRLVDTDFANQSAVVATTGAGIYATVAVRAAEPSGLRVTFGTRPEYWQQVLWHCRNSDCDQLRRVPLDVFEGPPRPVKLAVADDGRVIIVREDRITLLPPLV